MSKRRQQQQLLDSLTRSSKHFNKGEVECLVKLFNRLAAEPSNHFVNVGLDRNVFKDVMHRTFGMTDDVILDRVFRTFDKDNNNCISAVEWVEGLSVFLRGTLEEKIKYCFQVYDLNGDGYISRDEMFQLLKYCLPKQPSEEDTDEGIKDLVDIALKKMDSDHDGKISFMDFETTVRDDYLLLEAFGPCLPDIKNFECSDLPLIDDIINAMKYGFSKLQSKRTLLHLKRKLSRQLVKCN